jgi:hypothetical protein
MLIPKDVDPAVFDLGVPILGIWYAWLYVDDGSRLTSPSKLRFSGKILDV